MNDKVKIIYMAHSCLLIEINGIRLLTDPWLVGPCWAGNLWIYPPPRTKPADIESIDYIYISHAHEDHLHSETLSAIKDEVKKSAITIVPDFKKPYFYKSLVANGLNNITFINHFESKKINSNISFTMINNDLGDDDSSLLIETNEGNIFLQTDNLMSVELAKEIRNKYIIDIAFIMTTRTGVFPGFYQFKPSILKRLENDKSNMSYEIAKNIIESLDAKYIVPYASDICYLGELFYMNSFHMKSKLLFQKFMKESNKNVNVILMGPSDTLRLKEREVKLINSSNHDFSADDISTYAYMNRKNVMSYEMKERKYCELNIVEDIELFINKFNEAINSWHSKRFRVLWIIDSIKLGKINLYQSLPDKMQKINSDKNIDNDLSIYMPAYRLERLVRGDYKMGIVTLWNGSMYCSRNEEQITNLERYFWEWCINHSKFNVKLSH